MIFCALILCGSITAAAKSAADDGLERGKRMENIYGAFELLSKHEGSDKERAEALKTLEANLKIKQNEILAGIEKGTVKVASGCYGGNWRLTVTAGGQTHIIVVPMAQYNQAIALCNRTFLRPQISSEYIPAGTK